MVVAVDIPVVLAKGLRPVRGREGAQCKYSIWGWPKPGLAFVIGIKPYTCWVRLKVKGCAAHHNPHLLHQSLPHLVVPLDTDDVTNHL